MKLPRSFPLTGTGLLLVALLFPAVAKAVNLETLINERFDGFPLTPDNKHRLAAWSELKGDFSDDANTLTLNFGDLGKLEVYPNNFLLRVGNNRVYHLDRRRTHPRDVAVMNETLRAIFEQISLLANHDAHPDLIYFVDEHLAKKNLEPFEKLYLRHILIRFGRYDAARHLVEFKTEWLPVNTYQYEAPGQEGLQLVRKPIDPLVIKLDEATVRGYYLQSGGTVYVEDVVRDVFYATGEEYAPNVSAFKIFLQQLFTQTTNYVVKEEEERIEAFKHQAEDSEPAPMIAQGSPRSESAPATPPGYQKRQQGAPTIKPLYSPQDWMGKMLGLLRYEGATTDPEVAHFLVNQAFFPQLYPHLTADEKAFYDRLLSRNLRLR